MLVVKSIDIIEVKGERHEFYHRYIKDGSPLMEVGTSSGTEQMFVEEVSELIKGREFITPKGRTIVALSQQAQDVIGLQYEAWENQSRLVEELSRDLRRLKTKSDQLHRQNKEKRWALNEITGASFWIRLKWLFAGIKIPEA